MVLIKILKRKDASSLIVAILIALVVSQMLSILVTDPAARIAGVDSDIIIPNNGWRQTYASPIVSAALELILLEILAWIVIGISSLFKKKK